MRPFGQSNSGLLFLVFDIQAHPLNAGQFLFVLSQQYAKLNTNAVYLAA